jgi:hypothetical protein
MAATLLDLMNEVEQRLSRLILGWVTHGNLLLLMRIKPFTHAFRCELADLHSLIQIQFSLG